MSDSVWPHRQKPTSLPHPWDSPGKNTGVGCHCLLHRVVYRGKSLGMKNSKCVLQVGVTRASQDCWAMDLSQGVTRDTAENIIKTSYYFFPLFCSTAVISTNLSSSSLIHSSASFILLLLPSSVLFISFIVLFIFFLSFLIERLPIHWIMNDFIVYNSTNVFFIISCRCDSVKHKLYIP